MAFKIADHKKYADFINTLYDKQEVFNIVDVNDVSIIILTRLKSANGKNATTVGILKHVGVDTIRFIDEEGAKADK